MGQLRKNTGQGDADVAGDVGGFPALFAGDAPQEGGGQQELGGEEVGFYLTPLQSAVAFGDLGGTGGVCDTVFGSVFRGAVVLLHLRMELEVGKLMRLY